MDLVKATLTLRPEATRPVEAWSGTATRAWFVNEMTGFDLEQGDQRRPYALSGLLGMAHERGQPPQLHQNQDVTLRVASIETGLTAALRNTWLPALVDRDIHIGDTRMRVTAVTIDAETTYADLLRIHSLQSGAVSRRAAMRFESPTAFRSQHMQVLFPLPALVFGSLLDHWNTFSGVQLHPDLRAFAEECVGVSSHNIKTRSVSFDDYHQSGFVGYTRFVLLRGDRYWHGLIHALSAFAYYAGVGIRTTTGFGQIVPE